MRMRKSYLCGVGIFWELFLLQNPGDTFDLCLLVSDSEEGSSGLSQEFKNVPGVLYFDTLVKNIVENLKFITQVSWNYENKTFFKKW